VRLWNTADLWNPESSMKKSKSGVPFRIVAGHHGGTVSKIRTSYRRFLPDQRKAAECDFFGRRYRSDRSVHDHRHGEPRMGRRCDESGINS
jgi:hypothetical protein